MTYGGGPVGQAGSSNPSESLQRRNRIDLLQGRVVPVAHLGGLVDGLVDRLLIDFGDIDLLAAALDARTVAEAQSAAGRAVKTRSRHVRLHQHDLYPPLPQGGEHFFRPQCPRCGRWSWIAFQMSWAWRSRSSCSSWRARSRTCVVGVLHVDIPPRHDPVAQVAVQMALELGQGLPQPADDQVLERLPLEQPQRRLGDSSKCWWKCSTCLRMYSSSPNGSGKRTRPGISSRIVGHLLDLLQVEEEQASLVLVGQEIA